ncbi:hypothetical protein J5U21_00156 [Saccharolobus shibatae]|uniref:Uncharacterized protein n=1 Tax=Saccharolobus shibatae TaxID=2286 RepID=A0A8F5BS99_9CREN|nr:hypothetical protein J5U21_00156 [Saccharolobus shibatae]
MEKLVKGEGLNNDERNELKERLGRNLNYEKLALKQLIELLKSLRVWLRI